MAFELPRLQYSYDALEPYIDAKTMEIHHSKHHQTYITNLNKALESYPELFEKSLEDLLANLDQIPESIRVAVRNGGGGHYNHTLFWQIIGPKSDSKPSENMNSLITDSFESFDNFKSEFNEKATKQFGSGWGWLCQDKSGKLVTLSTPNQDTPISSGLNPILGIDVWEHAYYLNYQNKRPDYINAFWEIINWEAVESNLK
ncbi:MAG: superoxide dismutase [Thermodesulfobacteriota bacterium]|nr:superoxide dismutase [Deltaproteobacteria bacterium TMED58]RZP15723.1 MAG: superoxide dismutase [Candidatus Dadabacteria bacterium]|tara:strand:+ start:21844 stop:22446 length:603 start_codon:yes stop_codon:yes gene_type:complete